LGEPPQSPATVLVAEQVWERWRALSAETMKPWVALLFSSELDTEVARGKLAEAVGQVVSEFARTQENLPAGVDEVGAGAWNLAKVPEGVMLTVGEKCEAFELLLGGVAGELERSGVTGAFDLFEVPQVSRPPKLTDLLELRVRVNGERVPWGNYKQRWAPDPDALWRVVSAGARACLENQADRGVSLQVRTLPPLPVLPADDVEALLREGIAQAEGLGTVVLRSMGANRFRSLAVEPSWGRVTLVDGGSAIHGDGWVDAARELTDLLRATSGDLVYAFVKRGSFPHSAELGNSLEHDWPELPSRLSQLGEPFEDQFVPDAFGIQLLGPGFVDRMPTGPVWLQTPLDSDRTLVEHRDLAAWLRGPRLEDALMGVSPPDGELVAAARADFASVLFSEEMANDARTNEQ
jgi:hypothetical protein